jgi:hypothetical protein
MEFILMNMYSDAERSAVGYNVCGDDELYLNTISYCILVLFSIV